MVGVLAYQASCLGYVVSAIKDETSFTNQTCLLLSLVIITYIDITYSHK